MAIVYPDSTDSFNEPSLPEAVPLSEAGSGTRNHVEHHHDLGQAIVALEENAVLRTHDHNGEGSVRHGYKLLQANTHESPDTNLATTSLHHTIGTSATQAAAGNHQHDWNSNRPDILNRPYIVCTSTTRPSNPFSGMMIYETDTLICRVWGKFTGNPAAHWQLTPGGNVPVIRVESRAIQEIIPTEPRSPHTCWWTHVIEDWFSCRGHFVVLETSNTDVTIQEAGVYAVHTRLHWHPQWCYHDHSMVTITVNNQDIARKDWRFVRGYNYVPGFGQTHDLFFYWRFQEGDTLRVQVRHNATRSSWLYWCDDAPDRQVNHLDLVFHSV